MSWPAATTMNTRSEKRFLTDAGSARAPLDVAKTCPKIPALLPTLKTCGKASCRCTAGRLHGPYHYLRWREGGIHRREERQRERLDHALALMTWRQMARQLEAIEARIREEREHR
jgi:hypothetical protein